MTKKAILGLWVVIALIAVVAFMFYFPKKNSSANSTLQERLAACGSLPNNSMENTTDTSRAFINLPRDVYPNVNLEITSHGATANYISHGGQYGYALGAQGKPDCWSYYFEFDLASSSQGQGTVDIGSKSGTNGIPDYLVHINVTSIPSLVPTSQGTVRGQVLLGPTCPVERNPPDPNCAPRPYQTTITAFRVADTSTPYMTTRSNTSGIFTLLLNSGAYILRAQSGSVYPRCPDVSVQVVNGQSQNVTINCDTGIR